MRLLVDALAAYRLTRLVVEDSFPPLRTRIDRIVARHSSEEPDGEGGVVIHQDAWAELLTCPYCVSFWVSLGVVAARRLAPEAWQPLAEALSFSALAGPIVDRFD